MMLTSFIKTARKRKILANTRNMKNINIAMFKIG